MGKLHELLAVEGDLASVAEKVTDEARNTFIKKQEHFVGQVRTLTMFDEARSGENLTEEKPLVTTVRDKLSFVEKQISPYYDAVLQKDVTNQNATADLVIAGTVIAKDVPATFLLGMETKLKKLRKVYEAIPTLNPGTKFIKDEVAGKGIYKQESPVVGMKTEKTVNHKILYEATDHHPAQIEKWNEDVPIGRIETSHTSGMLSPAEKSVLLGNVDTLLRAVKKARQRANTTKVASGYSIAKIMFDFIHDGKKVGIASGS